MRKFEPVMVVVIVLALLDVSNPAWGESVAPLVAISADGKALLPIVVSPSASSRIRASAGTLVRYLDQITGAKFELTTESKNGIHVGMLADFPDPAPSKLLNANDSTRREDYLLRSSENNLYIVGATDLAVEDAVWDLLYRVGYRQYFQGAHWEIVPHVPSLSIAIDVHEHPCYLARRIWFGFGAGDYGKEAYEQWTAKNRLESAIALNTGHSYEGILHAYKPEFAAHPEYLALVNGKRMPPKFCTANPDLRKLVIDHALKAFEKDPTLDSISADPSDGGGWCECGECAKLGSISDRALLLANEIARAVNEKYPGKLVGMYAYAYHSPPPNIAADPHVVVSVATAFLKGGLTLEEIIDGWSHKVNALGIREYYAINTWDRDMPAAARGGNIDYLHRTIPEFYGKGARFMSAESGESFGPAGLGYYLASRMMWDINEAKRVPELVEDFLSNCFGPAKEPMRAFYRELDGSQPHLVASNQIGTMFRSIEAAKKIAGSPDVQARLDDLLLYCRYVDLYTRYSQSKGDARQLAFEAVIRHAYRMRKTMMVHSLAFYRDLPHRDHSVTVPPGTDFKTQEGKNPWKSSTPFTADELATFLAEGVSRYPITTLQFKPLAFSDDLISAKPLGFAADLPAGDYHGARGTQVFFTRIEHVPGAVDLLVTGGLVHYHDRGNIKLQLHKIGGASQTGERETLVAQDRSVPPDEKEHAVSLPVTEPGLYRLTVDDGHDGTIVKLAPELPLVIKSTLEEPMNAFADMWQLYFYVPKGTKVVGLFGGEHGEIHDSTGHAVFWLNGRPANYYSVDVPDGEDGKLWSVKYGRGPVRLLTVPPYFAFTAAGLLLPREVVEKDAAQ